MLHTLFPLLGYLDDQHVEFLKLWMGNHSFGEFPDLIEYYTTIGNGTLLKEEYNIIANCTLLQDINNLMYLTQLNFTEDTPNQVLHILSTPILWLKLSTLLLTNILPYMSSWPLHLKTYPVGNAT